MSVVFLIRHAHSEWTADEARSLSKQGTLAAQQLAARLTGEPIVAIYSSPSRRAVDTVAPLAEQLHLDIYMVENLREREVPAVRMSEFETMIRDAWLDPDSSPGGGGESNIDAQERGLAVMQNIIARHPEQHVAISTHGNLMALIMNALDKSFDYDFWRGLSFPEIYRLTFDGEKLSRAERVAEITVRK
jgi:2,3-bisphosphoglycerate-dependent phosphoglycerate mutase